MTNNQQLSANRLIESLTSDQWDDLACLLPLEDDYASTEQAKRDSLKAMTEFVSLEQMQENVDNAKEDGYSAGYDEGVLSVDDRYDDGYKDGRQEGYDDAMAEKE